MSETPHKPALVAIDGALALIAILLIVQMWLLSATLESYLSGHHAVVVPAALVSAGLSGACLVLAGFIQRIGR